MYFQLNMLGIYDDSIISDHMLLQPGRCTLVM